MSNRRLTSSGVKAFVLGQTLDCFDPESGVLAATIEYFENGTCHAAMADGTSDDGRYGFERELYWTQYRWFRNGSLNRFFLLEINHSTCQAYFEDGRKAFLQIKK